MSSFSQSAWKRLKKNKGAMAGIFIIVVAAFVGLFAYFIAPDSTPNADRQILEIQSLKPGTKQLFLKLKKESASEKHSRFYQLLFGKKEQYQFIPVKDYTVIKDSLILNKVIGEGAYEKSIYLISNINPLNNPIESLFETKTFLLGTDKFGRDLFSRLIIGVRVSLSVGLIAVIISLTLGVMLGACAGYFRGKTDDFIMWLINVVWSIPTLLLVFAITLALGKGFWIVFVAVGLTMWVSVARIIRGQVMSLRELEYVEAARAFGFSNLRIIIRHILPNVLGPVMVIAASNFASAIVIEAGLSFLGVGVQPPQPSWGLMIKENYNFIITNNPFLALAPGIAIMILVLAFNLLGNGLRDALDVRGRL